MISIFQNNGVEDLAAGETPESPIGHSRPVIPFHNHPSMAALAFHGRLLLISELSYGFIPFNRAISRKGGEGFSMDTNQKD